MCKAGDDSFCHHGGIIRGLGHIVEECVEDINLTPSSTERFSILLHGFGTAVLRRNERVLTLSTLVMLPPVCLPLKSPP